MLKNVSLSPPAIITVFAASPDQGRGLARDMGVRWALEEICRAYAVRPVAMGNLKDSEHLARQPFGQIPAYEDDQVTLFESGAIIMYLAIDDERLLPVEALPRARALAWMFAAASTVEPTIVQLETSLRAYTGKAWKDEALQPLKQMARLRLGAIESALGDREWLEERFTAGDILMIQALRRLGSTELLASYPRLRAYVARGIARPAFARAFDAQLDTWRTTTPVTDR